MRFFLCELRLRESRLHGFFSLFFLRRDYCCPITCELMKEPVFCVEDGQTYERCAVERWWSRSEAKTSPSTGATLASTTLAPNYALKSLIAGWKAQRSRARD